MDRRVGQRQAARDDEIGGRESQQRQHDELAAPAGSQVFQHAGGAAAIGRAADDIPIDGQRQEKRDEHDAAGGHRRPGPGRLGGDRWQIGQRAEVVDADQAQHERPRVRGVDRTRAASFEHGEASKSWRDIRDRSEMLALASTSSCLIPESITAARWCSTRSRSFQKKNRPMMLSQRLMTFW